MKKVPIVDTEEYSITGEFHWIGLILHADVHVKWTKGVRKRFTKSVRDIVELSYLPVYTFFGPCHDNKLRKFILSVGGTFEHYRYDGEGHRSIEMFRFHALD